MRDLHTHTIFSDGKNTPEEMIKAAISKGLSCIGFSDHGYTPFDSTYCMSVEKTKEYISEINRLKEKYKDKIEVLCGVEQDYYSEFPTDEFDYVIGSVHYIYINGEYIEVDNNINILKNASEKHFGGDIYSLTAKYFETVSDIIEKTNADIIGHFDLISKFNENNALFDDSSTQYIEAWKKAVDRLITYEKPFEINTGAIARGYRSFPYPGARMIEYIKSKGGKFILSGDSHNTDNICFAFEKYNKLI